VSAFTEPTLDLGAVDVLRAGVPRIGDSVRVRNANGRFVRRRVLGFARLAAATLEIDGKLIASRGMLQLQVRGCRGLRMAHLDADGWYVDAQEGCDA
jgi:hypothetical protein